MTTRPISLPISERPLTGRGVLLILVGFFGVVFAVNFYMARVALSTFSGEVNAHPYEIGVAYNKEIAASRAQDALGWTIAADVAKVVGGHSAIVVTARDADGRALQDLDIKVTLESPVDRARDTHAILSSIGDGVYSGSVPATLGRWEAVIDARDATGSKTFQSRSRISLD
jgi:nitrogen fixation protein FixH